MRLLDFDAWEKSKKRQSVEVTDLEIIKGYAAERELSKFLSGKKLTVIGNNKRDNYGRILVKLYANGQSVSEYMILHGHDRNKKSQ